MGGPLGHPDRPNPTNSLDSGRVEGVRDGCLTPETPDSPCRAARDIPREAVARSRCSIARPSRDAARYIPREGASSWSPSLCSIARPPRKAARDLRAGVGSWSLSLCREAVARNLCSNAGPSRDAARDIPREGASTWSPSLCSIARPLCEAARDMRAAPLSKLAPRPGPGPPGGN